MVNMTLITESIILTPFRAVSIHPLERLIVFYPKVKNQNAELIQYIPTIQAKSISVFK